MHMLTDLDQSRLTDWLQHGGIRMAKNKKSVKARSKPISMGDQSSLIYSQWKQAQILTGKVILTQVPHFILFF